MQIANKFNLLKLVTYVVIFRILANLVYIHYWLYVLSKPPDGGTKCSAKLMMRDLISPYTHCFYIKKKTEHIVAKGIKCTENCSKIQYVLTYVEDLTNFCIGCGLNLLHGIGSPTLTKQCFSIHS